MDTLFLNSFHALLQWEGGYNNIAEDAGGPTNYGISLRFLKTIDPLADDDTVFNLTKEQAAEIYHKHFWNGNGLYNYPLVISKPMLNFTVNMGNKQANKLLQRAIMASLKRPLMDDGIVGQVTLRALEEADKYAVAAALRSEAAGYYRLLARSNPAQKKFLTGWLRRAYNA